MLMDSSPIRSSRRDGAPNWLLSFPKLKKRRRGQPQDQLEMFFDSALDLSNEEQEYNPTHIINEIRNYVETWRKLPNPDP
jgi:hypothetical protein